MAITRAVANATATSAQFNEIIDHLEGASGSTLAYFLRVLGSNNFTIRLPDAGGTQEFRIQDSGGTSVCTIDSDGNVTFAGTQATTGNTTLTANLTVGGNAAVTGNADVGGTLELGSSNITTSTAAGLLKHEAGGLEFDASAITTGGLIKGDSAGVMEILAKGAANTLLTMNAGATDFAWTATSVALAAILTDFKDNRALLCWSDFTSQPPANQKTVDFGVTWRSPGAIAIRTAGDAVNGQYELTTSASSGYSSSLETFTNVVDYTKDPYFTVRLTSRAANSALQVQAWGFNDNTSVTAWDDTTNDCAMFRSITTGNLFAVTGDGSSETTTDLGSVHTLGNAATFEIVSSSNGGSYAFKINGTTRATHTGTLPNTGMRVMTGIANNTTTDLALTGIDFMYATQDRT